MEIGEVPIETIPEPSGKKRYEVEGTAITVAWKLFQPTETFHSQEGNKPYRTVIFLPGWSITEQAKSIKILCQTFANSSHNTAFALDTRAKQIVDDSLIREAEAVRQFIQERGLENITLVGNSLGGAQAIHLTALLQERNPNINIEGLILLDSVSLYDQTRTKLVVNYTRDMINTLQALRHTPQMEGSDELRLQNFKYWTGGIVEILKEMMHSNIRYPQRTINEIKSIVKLNPHLGDIKVPIVIIQGARDLLSNPSKIIPNQNPDATQESPYIEDIQEREEFLRKNVFTNSPYVKMIVPEKMGHHNVSYSRPRSVAKASLYFLERWHRQQKI